MRAFIRVPADTLFRALAALLFAIAFSLATSSKAYAGDRPDINTFSAAQRLDLVTQMQNYINLAQINLHLNPPADKHGSSRFTIWHRWYIKGLEDYLISQNRPLFVPLPKWNPANCIPAEFNVVDPDCPAVCNPLANLCPGVGLPASLSSNLCSQTPYTSFRSTLENSFHNGVHGAVGGVMGTYKSPGAPIFWLWHAYVDDIWFDWQCTCGLDEGTAFSTYPAAEQNTNLAAGIADAWMQDSLTDIAKEPNNESSVLWNSPDIWVRNTPATPVGTTRYTNEHQHQNPEYAVIPANRPYIYVKVRNRGCTPISGQLEVWFANASLGLTWQTSFTQVSTSPVTLLNIGAGREHVAQFHWLNIPQPTILSGSHFCLTARFVASPTTADPINGEALNVSIASNVKNSNQIAWKNLTIVDAIVNNAAEFLVRNIVVGTASIGLRFNNPAEEAGDTYFNHGPVRLDMGSVLFNRWLQNGAQGTNIQLTPIANTVQIMGDGATIDAIPMTLNEEFLMAIQFGPLQPGLTPCEDNRTVFDIHVSEFIGQTVLGGNTYRILPEAILRSPAVVAGPIGSAVNCTGGGVGLQITSGVPVGATVQWFRDNVLIAGATSPTHTATQSGAYTVRVTYSNGCDRFSPPVHVQISTPPSNDNPTAATAVGLGTPVAYNIYCATSQVGEVAPSAGSGSLGSCMATNGWCATDTAAQNSVWFRFTAPFTGMVNIHADPSHDVDHTHLVNTQMAVWTAGNPGSYSTYALVTANDDSGNHGVWGTAPALHDLNVTGGTNYYIQLDGYLGARGFGTLLVESAGTPPITAYCFGDGTGAACPCGNTGAAGNGCGNSFNPGGANLAGSGNPSVSSDTVVLTGSGMAPGSPCLYFQGTAQASVPFGDGILCIGGAIIRLAIKFNNAIGMSTIPSGGDPPLSVMGAVPAAGGVRNYSNWYRDSTPFCTTATFNFTNAVAASWTP